LRAPAEVDKLWRQGACANQGRWET
jgi:hypothetical protein